VEAVGGSGAIGARGGGAERGPERGVIVANDGRVAVLGVGMHPWGKWGRNFVEYGLAASRAALDDAALDWSDVQFVSGADTIRNGYPGFVSGATFSQALGWTGAPVASSYAACASGAAAIAAARAQILAGLCDVALVVGADTTPKGFFAPVGGERKDDPDWLRFRLLGATNPAYFALYARRRMELYDATEADFAAVKVKNARHGLHNPNARYRKEVTSEEVLASPVVADPLRLLEICATSDGGAALVLSSMAFAHKHAGVPVTVRAVSTVTPRFPQSVIEMPNFSTDSSVATNGGDHVSFRHSIALAAYEEAGIGPEDLDAAEVYDLSSALELDWYEDIGLCKEGEAEQLLRAGDTALGGRTPVNPSGGLSCFGEAIPAQAIAQVCELVWQVRGQAVGRQVEEARLGITANQGLFGHGSSVVVAR
jgi:acetyl-CoA acetyltransferase